jgi:D-ribose pyranase
MKKSGVLNHRLADAIARTGHTQRLIIADAGLPVPPGVERIDLAVTPGLPGVVDVVRAIAAELQVEAIVVADELMQGNHELANEFRAIFPSADFSSVPHTTFKQLSQDAIAIVRTGECTPFANLMLISGVTF